MKVYGLNDKQKKALDKLERKAARGPGFSNYAKKKFEALDYQYDGDHKDEIFAEKVEPEEENKENEEAD